jgi:hypothetical protein
MLSPVRTTLEIDDDVLETVKALARQQHRSAGTVVSSLLRESLRPREFCIEHRNGVPLLPRRPGGPMVTTELVNRLRDDES